MGNKISRPFNKKSPKPKSYLSNYHEMLTPSLKFDAKSDHDEKEHLVHHLTKDIFKGNFCSPIEDILTDPDAKILDVG
jgi:hypothetical protein